MNEIIHLIYAVLIITSFILGFHLRGKIIPSEMAPETPARKKHVTKYRAGNLLDPISPSEQRMEKMLEEESKRGDNSGEEE